MTELKRLSPEQLLLAVAQGAQQDATAISDLNTVMGRGAAAEYSAMLKDLAQNGLPGVNTALNAQIEGLTQLNVKWNQLKSTVKGWGMAIAVNIGQTFGLIKSDKSLQAQAENRARDSERQNQARLAGLAKEAEARRKAEETKVTGRFETRAADIRARTEEAMAGITVRGPQGDRLSRMGGVIAGQAGITTNMAQRQVQELELIRKQNDDLVRLNNEMKMELQKLNEG